LTKTNVLLVSTIVQIYRSVSTPMVVTNASVQMDSDSCATFAQTSTNAWRNLVSVVLVTVKISKVAIDATAEGV
jgi:hypothetical protein